MGISALFSTPWYEGTATATSGVVPWDLEVAIGGHAYKINVAEYQRSTLPMLRQPSDTGDEPGERSLNTEGWWKRTVTDWSMGAGQTYGDDPKMSANRSQYSHSVNVDPWTKGVVKLMDGTTQVYAGTNVTHMIDAGTEIYIYDYDVNAVKHSTKLGTTWYDSDIYGVAWTSRTSAADLSWRAIAWNGTVFAAVASSGTGNRVMTSPDGITWTIRTSAADNAWYDIAWNGTVFAAVSGTGTGNRVMTSPDGITWTIRTSPADNTWGSIAWNGTVFAAVSYTGTGNRAMTSPDGITWTIRTSAADNAWTDIAWNGTVFAAVASTGTGNRVMTSPDGITWTSRTSAADNFWNAIAWNGTVFAAVSGTGTGNRVMTSPDGITWTIRTSAADNFWSDIAWNGTVFAAISVDGTGNRVMTSPDGITWTIRTSPADNTWGSIAWNGTVFAAISSTGTGNRVMTSPNGTGQTTNTFRNMCVAGGYVYAALGSAGVRRTVATPATTTSSSFSASQADNIAFVNGFLIISVGNLLYTLSSSGVATLIYTHWDSSFVWDTFVETPIGIVAAGNGQSQGSFYFIGLDNATGGLKQPISAGNLPIGETINGAIYYQGLLLLGTNNAMRLATFSDGGVSYGPTFGKNNNDFGSYDPRPSSFSAVGQYIFFNWGSINAPWNEVNLDFVAYTGAGRVDLAQFTEPLVPAYATDIAIGQIMAPTETTRAVVAWSYYYGKIYRMIATSMGVYVSDPETTVDEGYIESSRFRYGVPEKKLFSSLDLRHKELNTSESVDSYIVLHDDGTVFPGSTTLIGTSSTLGTSSPSTPLSIHSLSGETASIVTVLKAPIPNSTYWGFNSGFLFRWTLRAALTPFRQDEILVPIILFDSVDTNAEYGHDTYYDTYAEFQFLKELESSRKVVTYQEGNGSYSVVVDRVIVKPYSWNNGKTFFNGTVYVRLLTVEV